MTVIASYSLGSLPFVISDVLISVAEPPAVSRVRRLPGPIQRFNAVLPVDARYTITDVLQKTVRIQDGFVLAFAGTVQRAIGAVEHFREVTQARSPTGAMFEAETAILERGGRLQGLSLLAQIREGERVYYGSYNVSGFRSRKFRFLRAAGSGAMDMLDVFRSYRGKNTPRELSPQEEGLSLALALSSTLIGKEMVTGEPTSRAFGGFYEISYLSEAGFTKLTDVAHIHWVLDYQPGSGLAFGPPVRLQKLEYRDSLLYFRDIDISDPDATADNVYIVREPSSVPASEEPSRIRPDLSHKWCVTHAYIRLPNGQVRYRNRVTYRHGDDPEVLLSKEGPKLDMRFRDDYFAFLGEVVQELEAEYKGEAS